MVKVKNRGRNAFVGALSTGSEPCCVISRYHRRALTERIGSPGKELEYVDRVVAEDPKNYHAWSHRQWLLQVLCLLAVSNAGSGDRSHVGYVYHGESDM